MKVSRLCIILTIFLGTQILAQRSREYQTQSSQANQYSYGSRNYPRTAEVYTPIRNNQTGRVPLDYEGNEYNKRMRTEHFTFDPEEDLRRR